MISSFQNWFEMAATMRGGINDGPYGLGHCRRVFAVARAILQGERNDIVDAFCILHDACTVHGRQIVWDSPEVWMVADAVLTEEVDPNFMTGEKVMTLHAAIEYSRCSSNAANLFAECEDIDVNTINICWDAEDMDDWRFGHLPRPEKMRTEIGAEIARQSKQLMIAAWKNNAEKMFALNPESCFFILR